MNFLRVNTTTAMQLSNQTLQSYENVPKVILLTTERSGPFFRVDCKDFIVEKTNGLLGLNQKYVMYVRGDAIRKYLSDNKLLTFELSGLLEQNKEEIEMDPEFRLLNLVKEKVPPNHEQELSKIYRETSRGRWAGLTQPVDFEEANRLYCLKQYIEGRDCSHLFKFYLNVPVASGCQPVAFFGKVKDGSSFQFKFNNAAMECIVEIEEIKNSGWPHEHN